MSKAFRLGVFIVIALGVFAGGIFLIGNKKFLFSSTYRLKAEFPNVAGLGDGAEVRVGGIHEGTIQRIDLPMRPDQKVTVEMQMDNATRNVIKKDSVASIRAEGLVGDRYLEISFGSDQAEKVKDGDTIQSEPPIEVSAMIKKADQILDNVQGAIQNVDATAGNLKSISAKINQGTGTAGALINDKSMYQRVNEGVTAFQEDMEALKHNFLLRGFFKNRGYEDSTELTKNEIEQLPDRAQIKTFTYDPKKIFSKPDTAKLGKPKDLSDAGKFLEGNKFGLAVVAVASGLKGDTEKERELTRARAAVVREYLVQNFKFDDTRLKTIGLGKSGDAEGDGNVEVIVYPAGTNVASSRAPAARR
jgi:phospholipid/cholesterol/gamma-HCH transport system substrate-binding protein